MQARHCPRAHSSTAHATRLLFAIALLVNVMLVPARLIAAGTGAWSPASDWSPTDNYHAVHLALLRGDGNP
ncbi:MAG: hypothetical protein HOP12_06060, partial [Candidatus Eisenbacteria bacterium]|nr:hypothetical protein [Candidatus Eisenbacteria bacterium]